jgi:hypothetical protein
MVRFALCLILGIALLEAGCPFLLALAAAIAVAMAIGAW